MPASRYTPINLCLNILCKNKFIDLLDIAVIITYIYRNNTNTYLTHITIKKLFLAANGSFIDESGLIRIKNLSATPNIFPEKNSKCIIHAKKFMNYK